MTITKPWKIARLIYPSFLKGVFKNFRFIVRIFNITHFFMVAVPFSFSVIFTLLTYHIVRSKNYWTATFNALIVNSYTNIVFLLFFVCEHWRLQKSLFSKALIWCVNFFPIVENLGKHFHSKFHSNVVALFIIRSQYCSRARRSRTTNILAVGTQFYFTPFLFVKQIKRQIYLKLKHCMYFVCYDSVLHNYFGYTMAFRVSRWY